MKRVCGLWLDCPASAPVCACGLPTTTTMKTRVRSSSTAAISTPEDSRLLRHRRIVSRSQRFLRRRYARQSQARRSITINGGIVCTKLRTSGGAHTADSFGIGTCYGNGGSVTINGGTIIAEASSSAISSGRGGSITINGGNVTAHGGINRYETSRYTRFPETGSARLRAAASPSTAVLSRHLPMEMALASAEPEFTTRRKCTLPSTAEI